MQEQPDAAQRIQGQDQAAAEGLAVRDERAAQALQAEAERRYVTWPPAQDNAVLKLARARLFNGRVTVKSAAHQQGLIQIVRDFCDHSNAACEHCRFPDLVRAAAASSVSATEAPSVP